MDYVWHLRDVLVASSILRTTNELVLLSSLFVPLVVPTPRLLAPHFIPGWLRLTGMEEEQREVKSR